MWKVVKSMNNEHNTETEIKLTTTSREVLESIMSVSLVSEKVLPDSECLRYLESHYYDTPTRKFSKNGVVFRVRKEPEGFIATVKIEKSNSGGLSERMEYNVALLDEKPVFSGFEEINFLVDLNALVAKDGEVQELFSVCVNRHQCELVIAEETVVEMAIDIGEITAGEKSMPVYEVEFEIKQGSSNDLIDFIALLSKEVPLFAEQKSKYYRGCELAGEKIRLEKAKPVSEVATDKPLKDALLAALIAQTGYALSCVAEKKVVKIHAALLLLEQMLAFSLPLFDEVKASEHLYNLDNLIKEITFESATRDFASLWADINKKTASLHTTLLLEKLLQDKSAQHSEKVQKLVEEGGVSSRLFALWAWLERAQWRNNIEISAKEYLSNQTQQLHEGVIELYDKGDTVKAYDRLYVFVTGVRLLKQAADKDVKYINKVVKALLKELEHKVLAEKIGKNLFSLFKASAGRLLYRDAGILLGYYFKNYEYSEKKIRQRYDVFRNTRHVLPEDISVDEDDNE